VTPQRGEVGDRRNGGEKRGKKKKKQGKRFFVAGVLLASSHGLERGARKGKKGRKKSFQLLLDARKGLAHGEEKRGEGAEYLIFYSTIVREKKPTRKKGKKKKRKGERGRGLAYHQISIWLSGDGMQRGKGGGKEKRRSSAAPTFFSFDRRQKKGTQGKEGEGKERGKRKRGIRRTIFSLSFIPNNE